MSDCSNKLHKTRLAAFKAYLSGRGIDWRPAPFDSNRVMDVRFGGHWMSVYERQGAKERYTVDRRMAGLVRNFIIADKAARKAEREGVL